MLSFFHIMTSIRDSGFEVKYFPENKKFIFKDDKVKGEIFMPSASNIFTANVSSICNSNMNLEIIENESSNIIDRIKMFESSCSDV